MPSIYKKSMLIVDARVLSCVNLSVVRKLAGSWLRKFNFDFAIL